MPKYRNVSGEGRSVTVLHGKWVEPDEVITVPDHQAPPLLIWPEDTWELVSSEPKTKKEN